MNIIKNIGSSNEGVSNNNIIIKMLIIATNRATKIVVKSL